MRRTLLTLAALTLATLAACASPTGPVRSACTPGVTVGGSC